MAKSRQLPENQKFIDTGLLQQIVKRFFPRIVNFRRLFLRAKAPNWLTSFAARLLPDAETDRYHQISMLGVRVAQNSSNEVTYASRHAVELRHPYRDRRLVEYVLALPAYQLYYQGIFKHVLRTAMRGILPETIRLRLYPTYMNSLFFRGFEMEQEIIQACAKNTGADWRKYVRSNWLSKRWVYTPKRSLPEMNVPWLCIAHEAWLTKTFKPSLFSETE